MNLDEMVVDDRENGVFRVHRSSMTSEHVLAAERALIFDRYWIYLGHESEVERRGDYRRRTRNGRPLIFLRNTAGEVGVLYDSCPHRGVSVCTKEAGNARRFTCFYHGWTFDTNGRLVSLPDEEGYGPGFDRDGQSLGRPPQLDSYRGFYFVSFNPHVQSLREYLGGAIEYIDLVVDQAEEGMRVVQGSNLYAARANWKLMVENAIDSYHVRQVHQTYFAYVKSRGGTFGNANLPGRLRELGNGHAVFEGEAPFGRPIARWDAPFGLEAKEEIASLRRQLVNKFGEERATRMADQYRNMAIFPNLILNDITAIFVRYLEPIAPDLVHADAWALAPKEESGARLARRIESYLTFVGPGGFATPDDVEALESCQRGYATQPGMEWNDISRGMTRIPTPSDELQIRGWWRGWRAAVSGQPLPVPVTLPESPRLAESRMLATAH
jgi:p-cumate 2,3-dioxygenase subunit alpha